MTISRTGPTVTVTCGGWPVAGRRDFQAAHERCAGTKINEAAA